MHTCSHSCPRTPAAPPAVGAHPPRPPLLAPCTDPAPWLPVCAAGDGGKKDTVVWDLLFLPDGTLVSADSEGAVQFWDGATGTLLRRFAQHQADVLRLAAAPDGRAVWAAGVDPQLAVFHRVAGGDGGWWGVTSRGFGRMCLPPWQGRGPPQVLWWLAAAASAGLEVLCCQRWASSRLAPLFLCACLAGRKGWWALPADVHHSRPCGTVPPQAPPSGPTCRPSGRTRTTCARCASCTASTLPSRRCSAAATTRSCWRTQ